jgi:gamma-glutamylcyclotransferase (GGCT)/AIG2-like uncharacterized protein YtfP
METPTEFAPWAFLFMLRYEMNDLLFAYGTLIPGCEPAQMNAICTRMELIGEGTVRGILYDLGQFPGVVEGDGLVRGVVLRVPPDAWPAMDAYEGCPIPGGDDGLFKRIPTRATLDTGEKVACWLYVYARDVRGRRAVESGDWRRRRSL